jgi:hypothetical protein
MARRSRSFENRGTEGTIKTPDGEHVVHSKEEAIQHLQEGAYLKYISPSIPGPTPAERDEAREWREVVRQVDESSLPDK